jgi:hypothetical protein
MNEIKIVEKSFYFQTGFCSFLALDSPKRTTDLARECPKFSWVSKLEAFFGNGN